MRRRKLLVALAGLAVVVDFGDDTMNRYYKHYGESLEGVGTVYLETEGDVVVRQVEVYGDRHFWSHQHTQSDITHRICDRPVSELRLTRADQTTPQEFEAVWRRARQDAQEISPDEEAQRQHRLLHLTLEDAGCTDAELLGHLRGPGPHVRG